MLVGLAPSDDGLVGYDTALTRQGGRGRTPGVVVFFTLSANDLPAAVSASGRTLKAQKVLNLIKDPFYRAPTFSYSRKPGGSSVFTRQWLN